MTIYLNKLEIQNCPAIYEYYPLNKPMVLCCYKYKNLYEGEKHQACKDCRCILKDIIQECTIKKGTIQEKLKVKWLD